MPSETLTGFADQALDSARAFRTMLDAMAHPGRILPLASPVQAPHPLLASTATIALTLCDYDTPMWLDETLRTPETLDYLRFHTGARIESDKTQAAFLIVTEASAADALAAASRGTPEYPDSSATLIIQLASLTAGERLVLTGPGIDGARNFASLGLSSGFWSLMEENHQLFPMGTDAYFASAGEITALPRSTHIKKEGQG